MVGFTKSIIDPAFRKLIDKTAYLERARPLLAQLLWETGNRIEELAVKGISGGSKTGFLYEWEVDLPGKKGDEAPDGWIVIGGQWLPIKERATPHRASAPGEYPATDTGQLVSHITHEPSNYSEIEKTLKMEVGVVDLDYAGILEDGTDFMEPRPWLEPSIDEVKPAFEAGLKRIIEKVIGGK